MKNPKYRIKMLAYPFGDDEPTIDKKSTGLKYSELKQKASQFLNEAIEKSAYEIIIDIFEETEGAK